ncbi:DUF6417 family protein [Streptomyces sp. JB150]|uniref:DUF6417 family protein n=1 Tax=Streptomyces sp. JB150 TaxID=2714844 RepID=UPI0019CF6834|nr:DUF6417 family protein [Streptomyces sp. JB150]
MSDRRTLLAALRSFHKREQAAAHGWVLDSDLGPEQRRAVKSAAKQGLVTFASIEERAALPMERRVAWAARLSPLGQDVLAYADAGPAPAPIPDQPAPGELLVQLRPAQMDALRQYVNLGDRLHHPPAKELSERVRAARFSGPDNRWRLILTPEQMASVAYAFHLRSLGGSAAEANQFGRDYGLVYRPDPTTGRPKLISVRTGRSMSYPQARLKQA